MLDDIWEHGKAARRRRNKLRRQEHPLPSGAFDLLPHGIYKGHQVVDVPVEYLLSIVNGPRPHGFPTGIPAERWANFREFLREHINWRQKPLADSR